MGKLKMMTKGKMMKPETMAMDKMEKEPLQRTKAKVAKRKKKY